MCLCVEQDVGRKCLWDSIKRRRQRNGRWRLPEEQLSVWGGMPPSRAFELPLCSCRQDYDHTIYEECAYVSSRTLVKCKNVRKKSDLKANGGICEAHKKFQDFLREKFLCEERRLMQENGQSKPKYSRFINQDGLVSEEYAWLMPSHRWESPLTRPVYDDAPDDDPVAPLINAEIYTEKDLIKMRRALLDRKMHYLKLSKEMLLERTRRRANELFSNPGKVITLGEAAAPVAAACASMDNFGGISKRIATFQKYMTGEWKVEDRPICLFGAREQNKNIDEVVDCVILVVESIVDCVSNGKGDFADYSVIMDRKKLEESTKDVKRCTSWRIPLSEYCIAHQMLDERQNMFVPCTVCHTMCLGVFAPPPVMCKKHMEEAAKAKQRALLMESRMSSAQMQLMGSGVSPMSPMTKMKSSNDPSKPLFGLPSSSSNPYSGSSSSMDKRIPLKRPSVDSSSRDDGDPVARRARLELTSSQITVGQVLSQKSPAVMEAVRRAELRLDKNFDLLTCARIRPFERSQFPPKPAVPRRVSAVNRPPVPPVRRSIAGDNISLQQHHTPLSSPTPRPAPGSESAFQRQFANLLPSQRRVQPPHRLLGRDLRASPLPIPLNPQACASSPRPTEHGNEGLVEDRRTPPPQSQPPVAPSAGDPAKLRLPGTQTRPYISSYRRNPPIYRHPGSQPGTAHYEIARHQHHLPPPPDPPILPLPGSTRQGQAPSVASGASEERSGAATGASSHAGAAPAPTGSYSSPDQDELILAPPPPPPVLRPRFPTILRKTDGSVQHQQPPPSSGLQPRPPLPTPLPRPPPASRPLPPHRLLTQAIRPLPPHRLIKSLPLPVVPPPRAPKPSPAPAGAQGVSEQAGKVAAPNAAAEVRTEPSTSSVDQDKEKTLVGKAGALSSSDMDPLNILAAVSEAARDSASSSDGPASATTSAPTVPPSKVSPTVKRVVIADEDDEEDDNEEDDEFEEEL
ncbi:hypothetical protein Q1695_014542 [Nippostrongylus brasiliensis]|nr:hypothetical protein Q1695_014542 [Nippostrongylus brasiliensis]